MTLTYSAAPGDSWTGETADGSPLSMLTHEVYIPAGTDPQPQGVALVLFADTGRFLCSVESVSPTIDVVFYQPPNPRLSNDGSSTVVQSDWDAYPVGTQIAAIQGFTLNSTLPDAPAPGEDTFTNGWWSGATQRPAHAHRVGGSIEPFAVVIHTTDMLPGTLAGLLTRWTTLPGLGDCAHFVIGRDASEGVTQLVPITKNANHAGGSAHGWFVAGGKQYSPNSFSVGIEVHCGGILKFVGGQWRLVEGGSAQGAAVPNEDVVPDATRAGVGYHVVTEYQYQQLASLLEALESQLAPLPDRCTSTSVETPPAWGQFSSARHVGHVTLDAANRGDPWPPTCEWMRTS